MRHEERHTENTEDLLYLRLSKIKGTQILKFFGGGALILPADHCQSIVASWLVVLCTHFFHAENKNNFDSRSSRVDEQNRGYRCLGWICPNVSIYYWFGLIQSECLLLGRSFPGGEAHSPSAKGGLWSKKGKKPWASWVYFWLLKPFWFLPEPPRREWRGQLLRSVHQVIRFPSR